MLNILVLCTGNSARSILGEALLNTAAVTNGQFRGFSAGSQPVGQVNPCVIQLLSAYGYDTDDFRSKSWDVFSSYESPPIDIVITVCDRAAHETCPLFSRAAIKTHWGLPDPTAESVENSAAAFEQTYQRLRSGIERLAALALESMAADELKRELDRIGASI
ncbi:MAG: arsenate reductase [Paracoccaceae bacterium]|jgi:arsenate reductase